VNPSTTDPFQRVRTLLRSDRAFFVYFCLLSLVLLDLSTKIAMMNQTDYSRYIGFLLDRPIDVVPYMGREPQPAFLWVYLPHIASPLTEANSAAVYFWLMAKIQGLIQMNFNLFLVAFLSKAIILVCCLRVALSFTLDRLPVAGRYVVLSAFALAFFYSHNVAFLNSLYGEHAFVAGIAIFLAGMVEPRRILRIVLAGAGLLLAASAKPQFFYLPALLFVCLLGLSLLRRERPDGAFLATLLCVQAVSLLPLVNASTKEVNYYHSLYLGSYKVMTAEERKSANIPPATLECIGVDWWHWKTVGPRTIDVAPAPRPCPVPPDPFTLSQVLSPYLHNPLLLIRLAAWSLPDQFTVDYFEVLRTTTYFRPSNGRNYHNGSVLFAASKLRDATVTRIWFVIVLAGSVIALLPFHQRLEIRVLTLFLALAVPTQIAMCLLGEGVRDLCRHLAGAQLCLDVLSMICLLQLVNYLVRVWHHARGDLV
jgi:hypothetical protein